MSSVVLALRLQILTLSRYIVSKYFCLPQNTVEKLWSRLDIYWIHLLE